jgi:glycosyltransferase involved in cell wall biosynthesis
VTFYMPTLGTGGVGRMRTQLARALLDRGVAVDFLLGRADGPYLPLVDPRARVRVLGTTHPLTSLPGLVLYLRRVRPDALYSDRMRLDIESLRASRIAGVPTRICTSFHVPVSQRLDRIPASKARAERAALHRYLPRNQGIVAVSRQLAEDLERAAELPPGRVSVVYNPVVTPGLADRAAEPVEHPFLAEGRPPLILGVGRLTAQKDFPTLLRAFARLRASRPCRLLILGEGEDRPALEALAKGLGVAEHVALPGFTLNPYRFMARADLMVLSSTWEGSPNVLVEALALGTPVVSTDCDFGPRETLRNGEVGPLVPPGDDAALALAMAATLDGPSPRALLQGAASRYTAERCAEGYLRAAGLLP